ncbi:hypothetical protein BGL34_00185 [Fructilactobacillus lindneri]|uniref:DUF3021 domain-containing protein n=2 Tax=Fructilactobacillus lindneri TaxID=53444 RepID=A0A0R2JXP0_9LACO|nr:DUF3021 domain-containing protein [Fructilactobacillus lindneri]ANZ58383.1 hypothetical protein AYR60_06395 [Fructilactobacillus lindneri]ANZ59705.1 hypothetical protein AYR59_06650 [Fructilactobacillus lindneri]KRN79223.1 hypothetical protein IV52_GL000630 [Fructilactobacillus lindneri DSM 20690 = JCM 11027]POG98513.1 hypothetical protein BGL31_00775 [Fructilactobacillus lindneri]POH03901.1 hypothetical protein BGL32_00715 [Fructilactobacillus lindneri]
MGIFKRILCGAGFGTFFGFWNAVFFSWIYHSTEFIPSTPIFMQHFTSNLTATIVSGLLWMIIGMVFSFSGLIFRKDNWSITKKTIVHFCVTYTLFLPLAVLCGWFKIGFWNLILFTMIFIIIYIFIWISSMIEARQNVLLVNQKLKRRNQ